MSSSSPDQSTAGDSGTETRSTPLPRSWAKWRDPIVISTVVIAIAATLNLIATVYIGLATREYVEATRHYVQVTQDTFNATNRPYVGLSYIGSPPTPRSSSESKNTQSPTVRIISGGKTRIVSIDDIRNVKDLKPPFKFPFKVSYENFGTIPAREVSVTYIARINGDIQPVMNIPLGPSTIFPQESESLENSIESNQILSVIEGSSVLEIEVEIKYKGVKQDQYVTREKARYNSNCGCYDKMASESQ